MILQIVNCGMFFFCFLLSTLLVLEFYQNCEGSCWGGFSIFFVKGSEEWGVYQLVSVFALLV